MPITTLSLAKGYEGPTVVGHSPIIVTVNALFVQVKAVSLSQTTGKRKIETAKRGENGRKEIFIFRTETEMEVVGLFTAGHICNIANASGHTSFNCALPTGLAVVVLRVEVYGPKEGNTQGIDDGLTDADEEVESKEN